MSISRCFPIVGMNYRPPASALVKVLATGTPLILRPEPQNLADSNAKAVWVRTRDISDSALAALDDAWLRAFGMSILELTVRDEWQLGYIPAVLASQPAVSSIHDEIEGTFSISSNGAPRITIEI